MLLRLGLFGRRVVTGPLGHERLDNGRRGNAGQGRRHPRLPIDGQIDRPCHTPNRHNKPAYLTDQVTPEYGLSLVLRQGELLTLGGNVGCIACSLHGAPMLGICPRPIEHLARRARHKAIKLGHDVRMRDRPLINLCLRLRLGHQGRAALLPYRMGCSDNRLDCRLTNLLMLAVLAGH